jgi:hypothetical protein
MPNLTIIDLDCLDSEEHHEIFIGRPIAFINLSHIQGLLPIMKDLAVDTAPIRGLLLWQNSSDIVRSLPLALPDWNVSRR